MKQTLIIWIIWLALLGGIAIYAVVGLNVERADVSQHSGDQVTMERVLLVASVIQIAFSFVIRGLFITLPGLMAGDRFKHTFAGQIIVWAMVDAVAVYGLVLYFTGSDLRTFMGYLIAGGVGLLLHAPIWTFLRAKE